MHRHAPIIGPLRLLDKQTKTIIKLKFENSRIQSCKTQDRKPIWVWKIGWFSVIRSNEAQYLTTKFCSCEIYSRFNKLSKHS